MLPRIPARQLLKSWAMPPARFAEGLQLLQLLQLLLPRTLSVMSRKTRTIPACPPRSPGSARRCRRSTAGRRPGGPAGSSGPRPPSACRPARESGSSPPVSASRIAEHFPDRAPRRLFPAPPRHALRGPVHEFHVPARIGRYDAVGDRSQRDLGPLLLPGQLPERLPQRGHREDLEREEDGGAEDSAQQGEQGRPPEERPEGTAGPPGSRRAGRHRRSARDRTIIGPGAGRLRWFPRPMYPPPFRTRTDFRPRFPHPFFQRASGCFPTRTPTCRVSARRCGAALDAHLGLRPHGGVQRLVGDREIHGGKRQGRRRRRRYRQATRRPGRHRGPASPSPPRFPAEPDPQFHCRPTLPRNPYLTFSRHLQHRCVIGLPAISFTCCTYQTVSFAVHDEDRPGQQLQLLDEHPVGLAEGAVPVIGKHPDLVDPRGGAPPLLGEGKVDADREDDDVLRELRRLLVEPARLRVARRRVEGRDRADDLHLPPEIGQR